MGLVLRPLPLACRKTYGPIQLYAPRGLHCCVDGPDPQVTVKNYRKFKVLETLTAEADASVTGGRSSGPIRNSSSCFSDDEGMGVGRPPSSSTAEEPLRPSTGPMRTRKKLRPASTAAGGAAATVEAGSSGASQAPPSASAIASPAARPSLSAGNGAGGGLVDGQTTPTTAAAEAVASRRGDEVLHTASLLDSGRGKEGEVAVPAGAGPGAGATSGLVTAKEMAAMKDPSAFHEALTLPFTGDSSVDAYFQRIGRVMGQDVSSVSGGARRVQMDRLTTMVDKKCQPQMLYERKQAVANHSAGGGEGERAETSPSQRSTQLAENQQVDVTSWQTRRKFQRDWLTGGVEAPAAKEIVGTLVKSPLGLWPTFESAPRNRTANSHPQLSNVLDVVGNGVLNNPPI